MDPNRKIIQLSMLTPADEIGRWNLENLKEIWNEGRGASQSPIFITHDGRQLGRSDLNKSLVATAVRERVYIEPVL